MAAPCLQARFPLSSHFYRATENILAYEKSPNHLTQTLSGRLLPRLLPLTLFFLAGATWLLQKPPGTIVLVVEKAGAIKHYGEERNAEMNVVSKLNNVFRSARLLNK